MDRSLTREEIYSEFEEFGDILECDIKQARNANHSNFGFVKYHDLNLVNMDRKVTDQRKHSYVHSPSLEASLLSYGIGNGKGQKKENNLHFVDDR